MRFLMAHFKFSLAIALVVVLSVYGIFWGLSILNLEITSSPLSRIHMGLNQFIYLDQVIDHSVKERIGYIKLAFRPLLIFNLWLWHENICRN